MNANETFSLFNGINFFRRASQTWAAIQADDTDGLSPSACQFEALESRVLMSVAHPVVHEVAATPPPKHTVTVKNKAKAKAPTPVAPSAPSNLTATPLTFNSVQLSWTAGGGSPTGYVVLRGTDGTHYSQIAKFAGANTTYTDKSAASFHTYDYEVEAYTGALASTATAPAVASTTLAPPATFTATATGPASVQLTWVINEPLALGYNVLRSTDGVHFSQLVQLPAIKVGAYADTTVSSNTAYSYEVQAYNGNKTSAVSSAKLVTTPLTAPSALSATFQNAAVNLTWTGNDSSATGYYVSRSSDGKTFTQVANVSGNTTTTYSDSTVLSGHSYTYKVQACAGSNSSATTAPTAINTPLTAPSALAAMASAPTTVHLAWTDNDVNAAGYYVLRSTDGVHYTQIAKLTGAAVAAYVDTVAVSGTSYTYQVRAFAGTITSEPTTATVTTALAAPVTLTATAASPTSVKLTWTISDPLAGGYNVLRSADGVNFSQITALSGKSDNSYTDTVSSATAYTYEVQAYNASNSSAVSRTAAVTTSLIATSGLAATVSGSSVQLNWTDNDPSATGYYVLRASDAVHFTQLANLTSASATAYTDSTTLTGHAYSYELQAYGTGTIKSAITTAVTAAIPLVAPSGLAATVLGANSVALAWTDNDPNAAGYLVLRAIGDHFSQIAKLSSATAVAYTDTTAVSGQNYVYEIQAVTGVITSPASASALATTPLAIPTGLTAIAAGPASVTLAWVNKEPLATGYNILRSTDGTTYTQLTQIASAKTLTYADTTASSDSTYYYEVQATTGNNQSAVSAAKNVTTPLIAPSGVAVTFQNGAVQLSWTDNDSTAAGYYVMRASDGKTFAQIANLTGSSTTTYSDATALSGHTYTYEVQAYNGLIKSAVSPIASTGTPLAAPSSLTVTADTAASVQLSWTDNDANALGYYVLRATDGTHFTQIGALTSHTASSYADTKLTTGASYTYEVEAYAGSITSAASNTVNPTIPLATPTGLTATLAGSYVNLAWTDKDAAATGYNILRSTDGVTFTQLTQLTGATAKSYTDITVAAGQAYFYQVQAYNTSVSSAVSATATVTTPSGNVTSGVSVTTRFGDELVITAAGTSDAVSITESGSTLTITGDGQTFTDTAPAAGTFVYTRGGSDSINVDSSVTSSLTIDSIDGAATVIDSNGTAVSAWIDSTDTLIGTATAHSVASFAGGVSKALGVSLANPKDAGTTAKDNLSLFGTGPTASDVNQGEVGDCYFLASLAGFANQNPQVLTNSAVDLGDGTYAVEFHNNSGPVYVRVNNSFTVGGFNGYAYAHPGANNTIWAAVMEKAFAYFRTGANTYNSINSGWMNEVYTDLGVQSTSFTPSAFSDNDLFNQLANDLVNGDAVTMGTQNAPNLVESHAYTLVGVSNSGGVNHYIVRNPWGQSGDSLENSQGIATLTYAQFVANFVGAVAA